ncbi:hypothetical protein FQB35_08350 [Crassaminicella thermophila]|uniref:Uncharacterized protein n=1 Tax=Crassaminicella thermophila TaxID=2599308 RepID=A0A5C0SCX5_CRATE|nr:hypothetical protein [Crassaminicella thermophila]QEK12385.1 hypothetical protein FQB35_08350 [Crassaminicella thermophila]
MFNHKQIPSKESYKRSRLLNKFSVYVILIILTIMGFIYFSEKDTAMNNVIIKNIYNNIFNGSPKKKIFIYLKTIQPLEDKFYLLVNENVDLVNKTLYKNKEDIYLLKENIETIDSIMLDLAKVQTNEYMLENNYLFLDEMKIMRDIMLEKKFALENNDIKSLMKANEYLEKYFIIGQIRRQALKKVFDKYNIVYLELGNRIKYITK